MNSKKLVIIGAGGFGREIMWQLNQVNHFTNQFEIMGFVDDDPELNGKFLNGFPVVGNIQWLIDYPYDICAVICVGNSNIRKQIYNRIKKNLLISFPSIIAKDVQYSDTVTFGQGCIVCLSNILTVNINIGEFTIINLDCTIGHDVILENFVTLYPSANISGNVHIGTCTEIGTGVNIIQNKNIGNNTVIGAGSVVINDLPDNCTAVGVPARPIKFNSQILSSDH